jgi:hypothetical protein
MGSDGPKRWKWKIDSDSGKYKKLKVWSLALYGMIKGFDTFEETGCATLKCRVPIGQGRPSAERSR